MTSAGTYIRFSLSADYHPSPHDLWNALAYEGEKKARQMFALKEPKKRIPVSTVQITRRYEKRFTGRKFRVGGQKK